MLNFPLELGWIVLVTVCLYVRLLVGEGMIQLLLPVLNIMRFSNCDVFRYGDLRSIKETGDDCIQVILLASRYMYALSDCLLHTGLELAAADGLSSLGCGWSSHDTVSGRSATVAEC